ncbi:MAG TPA: AMP-binding protein [Acidimicrobiia bacterium]|nr:AMP-binding protein [Acidimicrobiia bacterium]
MGLSAARREWYRARGLHTDERIGWVLTRAADRWPDREALVFEGRRLTYGALQRWVTAVAADLHAAGLRPGDRLLWQLPNSLEGVVLHLAGWRLGLVCVPVVPLYREHEMAHILADADPTAVAFPAALGGRRPAEEMAGLLDRLGLAPKVRIAVGEAGPGWSAVRPPPAAGEEVTAALPDPLPAEDCCLVLYTSGTTSAPKGARHHSAALLAEAATLRAAYGFRCGTTLLMGAPITHSAGLLVALVLPATFGGRTVLLPAWDPDRAVALAEAERAEFCAGATVFLSDLVERYERGAAQRWRLSVFMCGGSAVPPSVIERADAVGVKAFRCWGMTEAPTTTLAAPDDPLEWRARRDGRASEGTEIEAVDEERRPRPAGELGELRVRSPEQMLGYTDPAVDAAQVDEDGWFYTGDIGSVTADGWVTMAGRKKDIVNRGGEKFSCADIEAVIAGHPAIAAVAVTGVPDDRLGEKVAAFVALAPGAGWPGRAELAAHLEQARLARQKFPAEWRVVEAIPMTMSGKIQKHVLLARWHEELAAAGNPD